METNRQLLIKRTPGFEHRLFDDDDCRNFIADNFPSDVLIAYDSIVPGAFKADMWRYCVLFINGGVYMDIKLNFSANTQPQTLLSREHYPLDVPLQPPKEYSLFYNPGRNKPRVCGIYQGLLVCQQRSPILAAAIDGCVSNIKARYYGANPLSITGPCFLYDIIRQFSPNTLHSQQITSVKDGTVSELGIINHYLVKDGSVLCYPYSGYRYDMALTHHARTGSVFTCYAMHWKKRTVYRAA